jgi:hypothetical protein
VQEAGEMSLPADIARCPGIPCTNALGWTTHHECVNCARRTEGIRDYMAGANVAWMEPPTEAPCPERLEPKR